MRVILTAFLILCAGWLIPAGLFACYRLVQITRRRKQ